jgi:hypothetical protein
MSGIFVSQIVFEVMSPFTETPCNSVSVPTIVENDFVLAILSPANQDAQVIVSGDWVEIFACENDPLVAPLATALLYKIAGPAEPSVYTFEQDTGSGSEAFDGAILIGVYRGVDTSDPLNTTAEFFALTPDNEFSLPSISPSVAGCALVGVMTQAVAVTGNTAPLGYESRDDAGYAFLMDRIGGNAAGPTGTQVGTKFDETVGCNTYHLALNAAAAGSPNGSAIACINSQGHLYITLDDGESQLAYTWDEGATFMPIASVTNWTQHTFAANVMELLSTFESDTTTPLILTVHRNVKKTFVRDAVTTSGSATVASVSYGFTEGNTGDMVCIFGTDIGGTGVNYVIARIATVPTPTTITLVDLDNVALLLPVSLNNLYMAIGAQVFTYDLDRIGNQVSGPLQEPLVEDCVAHAIGLHLLTNATSGRVFNVTALGTESHMPVSLTS